MLDLRHVQEMVGYTVLRPFGNRPSRNNVTLLAGRMWGVDVVCKVSQPLGATVRKARGVPMSLAEWDGAAWACLACTHSGRTAVANTGPQCGQCGGETWSLTEADFEYIPGPLEMEAKTAHLLSPLPKIADLLASYLFGGRVPTALMASLLDDTWPAAGALLAEWQQHSHVDLIITEHFGPTLRDRAITAAREVADDAALEEDTLRMLLLVFESLQRLRDDGATAHQDAKLDNMGEVNGGLRLIDLEFAHSRSMPNPIADFDGCAMTRRFVDGFDELDVHTVLYSLLYFCGARYRRLPRLETLRCRVLGHSWPTPMQQHPHLNQRGFCIVYMEARPPLPGTFEHAITTTRQLLASHA